MVNQHFKRKGCFSTASCEVLRELLLEVKTSVLLLCNAYNNIITLMLMFATYRVKVVL